MSKSEDNNINEQEWYYENNGLRHGPVSTVKLRQCIDDGTLGYGSMVWNTAYNDWKPLEESEFRVLLKRTSPPPLRGSMVKNNFVWIIAFAPIFGTIIETLIGIYLWGNYNHQLWFITLLLNIFLCFSDANYLKSVGVDTSKFRGFIWLVPVYLFQRVRALKQGYAYFITWIICFVLSLFIYQ